MTTLGAAMVFLFRKQLNASIQRIFLGFAAGVTEVVDLPTTGVNTERIWLLEHFADWFNVNLGKG